MTSLKTLRRRITRSGPFVRALALVTRWFILAYYATLRVEMLTHPEHDKLDRSKVLYGFWHGRQFLLVPSFRGTGIAIMTDLSWAGEIQTRVLEGLGYNVVRGSSRRRPARALMAMKAVIERGHPAAFALDGPRGPAGRSKPGAVYLASRLSYPLVPVGTAASSRFCIPRTWCDYQLPLPFSRCVVKLGAPLWIDDVDQGMVELDREVDRITREADEAAGRRGTDRRTGARGASQRLGGKRGPRGSRRTVFEVKKSDEDWRHELTPEQYRVTRDKGTEPPFTGEYDDFKGEGTYYCVACGNPLFRSSEKYDSGSGWPSFWAPASEDSIVTDVDDSIGLVRTEVRCGRCGAHLGHVFEDGPEPTGLRYCTNSVALDFEHKKRGKERG